MSERPSPTFTPLASVRDLLSDLATHQTLDSPYGFGERTAARLLAMTPEEMVSAAREIDERDGELERFVDLLCKTQRSLADRLAMVTTALDRLEAIGDVLDSPSETGVA